MSRRSSLQTVKKLRHDELDQARLTHTRLMEQRRACERRASEARDRAATLKESLGTTVASDEWVLAEMAQTRLLLEAKHADEEADRLRGKEAEAAEAVAAALARARAMDRLVEQRETEEKKARDQKEQAALDESATMRFARGRDGPS